MEDKMKERIELLLRKAESTDSPAEAEALTSAAEKLMIKHGIDKAMLDIEGKTRREEIVIRKLRIPAGPNQRKTLEGIGYIATALKLRMFYNAASTGMIASIIGFETDADDAVALMNSLMVQCASAMETWWVETGRKGVSIGQWRIVERRSFTESFYFGAADRIRANRKTVIEEHVPGAALVLADRAQQVNAFTAAIPLRAGRASGGRSAHDAGASGYRAGQAARTGEKGVGYTKSLSS